MAKEGGEGGGNAAHLLAGVMRSLLESDNRQCRSPPMRESMDDARRAKKRGSIRRWSLMKVVANGRGRRKRRLPFWTQAEGGGSALSPTSGDAGPREEVRCGVSATIRICGRTPESAMNELTCQ